MTLGILGVGHLAGYLVSGLRGLGFAEEIRLSPRNRETAARLAEAQDCQLCSDNQAVVEAAEVVFLTVPAKDAARVLAPLAFRPEQLVISACAGQSYSTLKDLAAPAKPRDGHAGFRRRHRPQPHPALSGRCARRGAC